MTELLRFPERLSQSTEWTVPCHNHLKTHFLYYSMMPLEKQLFFLVINITSMYALRIADEENEAILESSLSTLSEANSHKTHTILNYLNFSCYIQKNPS